MDAATTHVSADTDALASLVALRRLHPGARLVLPGGMEPGAQQLWHDLAPDLPEIESPRSFLERLRREPGGTLHVADTAAPGRLGTLAEQLGLFERVLCWDTHPAEPGDLPRQELPRAAASTSPLVLELHRRGLEPSAVEAGLFLVGIHDDTHHFTVHETSAVDHDAAAICLAWGADPGWPIKYVPRSLTSRQLKLLETISASVELTGHAPGAIAIATLETDEFEPGLATLVGQLRLAEGWAGAFLLAASRGRVDVIARSVPPLDVAAVLSPLGGGGHPGAASATLRGETLHDAKALLAEALESCRGPERTAAELAVARFVRARASDSVRSVADLLHERAVNAVPLFRGRGANLRYVGLVTRREVEGALRHGLAERPAIEISARAPQWIAPETPAAELHRTLTPATGRLAIVGHPPAGALGIVTRTSLLLEAGRQIPLASARKAPSPSSLLAQARRALPEAWPEIEALGDLADELGMTLHLVGGPVRDLLADRSVRDVDLVVEGDAPALAEEAVRRFGGERRIHRAFRTATFRSASGIEVDIATARAEFYEAPASLPRVEHAGLRRDLMRRDFTINAMALTVDPSERGRLHDPYGGLEDLKNGILRVLHGLSFHDDPTRAFRAARFCARLDARLAPETASLLRSTSRSGIFDTLGESRLGAEIDAILREREAKSALRLLRDWRLLEKVAKPLRAGRSFFEAVSSVTAARFELAGVWGGSEELPPATDAAEPLWIVLGMATDGNERRRLERIVPGRGARRRLWTDGPDRVRAARRSLTRVRSRAAAARVLSPLAPAERIVLYGLASRDDLRERLSWWEREGRAVTSAVRGGDLLRAGARPGESLGRALRAALDAAWNGADPEGQRRAALRILDLAR